MQLRYVAIALLLAVALVGCVQPGMERPDPPDVADELDVSQSEGDRAAAMTRGGGSCTSDKLILCANGSGSTWPDSHDGSDFEVRLKFNKKISMHLLSVRGIFSVRYGAIVKVRAINSESDKPYNFAPDWLTSRSAKEWRLTISPAPNRSKVILSAPVHPCRERRAICTTDRHGDPEKYLSLN